MRRGARLLAVSVAVLAWAAVGAILADWSGLLAPRSTAVAAGPVDDDLCALRQYLPVGNDARCAFPIEQQGGPPLEVELRQTWVRVKPPVLSQHLRVGPPGAASPLVDLTFQSAATAQARRILRLAVVPSGTGEEHLVYVVGQCGGTACGRNEVVIARWVRGRMEELLRRPVGALAEIELAPGRVAVLEGSGRVAGGRFDPRILRTFTWAGDHYVESGFHPFPTPSATSRPSGATTLGAWRWPTV
ncbi:MAG: hypothetical protein KGQ88_01765 [Chloroflexi bacterium]|nr:hypothetical protein [Chloroflexota bacterium]